MHPKPWPPDALKELGDNLNALQGQSCDQGENGVSGTKWAATISPGGDAQPAHRRHEEPPSAAYSGGHQAERQPMKKTSCHYNIFSVGNSAFLQGPLSAPSLLSGLVPCLKARRLHFLFHSATR